MPRPRHEEVMGRGPTGTESHGFRMSERIAGAATAAQQSVSIASRPRGALIGGAPIRAEPLPADPLRKGVLAMSQTQPAACYHSMQRILMNAFNIQTHFFTPPYDDFKKIDQGMRAAIWSDYHAEMNPVFFSDTDPDQRILVVKSNLGFYNIIATLKAGPRPEFLTVGPFRDNELSASYFAQIVKEAQIAPTEIRQIRYMYEKMPLARPDAVINVMKDVLEI